MMARFGELSPVARRLGARDLRMDWHGHSWWVTNQALPELACVATVGRVHQSRVYHLLVDAPEAEAAAAVAFWSAALGATARPVPQEPQFTMLDQALPGLE